MLPDYPEAKRIARRHLSRLVRRQMPLHEPILQRISRSTVHEGTEGHLLRRDKTTDHMHFQTASAEAVLDRSQMRRTTPNELLEKIASMSQELAGQQVQLMFSKIADAVERVGNTVSASEIGNKAAFLEVQRKLELDFDPETLEPRNLVLVLHPSQLDKFKAQAEEWEKDPEFVKEMEAIRTKQLEAWRARENRRTLVD